MRQWMITCAVAALVWPAAASAEAPAPEAMAQSIASTLRESGELSNYRVGVKYEDGVAWLLGTVTSEAQAARACELAEQVTGVDHVVNKLEVKSTAIDQLAADAEEANLQLTAMETPAAPQTLQPAPLPQVAAAPQPRANQGLPRPLRLASAQQVQYAGGMPSPQGYSTAGNAGVSYDQANMPNYAWPSYAAHPNYAALTYPKQYSASAWPYIGPFYPYPQVPLGWRKVTLEWDDGWWNLDFSHHKGH